MYSTFGICILLTDWSVGSEKPGSQKLIEEIPKREI